MKSNELRIGNLVYFNGNHKEVGVVSGIQEFLNNDGKIYINRRIDIFYYISHIKPIPLTKKWLIKFGFEFRDNKKQYGWYLGVSKNRVLTWCHSEEISLEFDKEDYNYNNTLFDFNCKYVHQLQNLYFALKNEEI